MFRESVLCTAMRRMSDKLGARMGPSNGRDAHSYAWTCGHPSHRFVRENESERQPASRHAMPSWIDARPMAPHDKMACIGAGLRSAATRIAVAGAAGLRHL
jgi:hypothetical protein